MASRTFPRNQHLPFWPPQIDPPMKTLTAIPVSLLLLFTLGQNLLAQPSLSRMTPGAVTAGQTVEVTLSGDKLDWPLQAWASFPGKLELVAPKDSKQNKSIQCKITVNAGVGVGVVGIAVGNKAGASDVLLVMVDDVPTVVDNGKNHTWQTAQAVNLPNAVDGVCEGKLFDYYKVAVKKGQRLSAEVVAARLNSKMDPVLRILNASGQELAAIDDDPGLGADCRLGLTATEDAEYIVEVGDNKYLAGNRYRLRIGDFPLVTTPFPLGGRLGSTAEFAFTGVGAEGLKPLLVKVPSFSNSDRLPVSAKYPDGKSSAMAVMAVSDLPAEVEKEPNDERPQATRVTVPCALNGVLQKPNDQDYFQFVVAKGERLTFRAITRSVGSPTFLTMQLHKADGAKLVETKVGNTDEWTMSHAFAEEGTYFLRVEDLLHGGSPDHAYHVQVSSGASFGLTVKNDKNTKNRFRVGRSTGAFTVNVQCARTAFDGPVTIGLEQPIAGIRLLHNVIAAKGKEANVVLALSSELKEGDLKVLRLVGTGMIDGRAVTVPVRNADWLRTQLTAIQHPPGWQDGRIYVAAGPPAAPIFETSVSTPIAYLSPVTQESKFTLALARKHKDFKAAIRVSMDGLPGEISAAVKQEKDQYHVTVKGSVDMKEGQHALHITSYGDLNGQGQIEIKDVVVQVVTPLKVELSAPAAVVVGQSQKVKVKVVRGAGSNPQPVTLKWKNLPAGVTGDETITIAADQSELEVELKAAADAKVGKFSGLALDAQ
ncbi:MAG: hypothetical protein VX644_05600, partial [Planctomycetota bacterium]|nr:hypothetical protein [Planctomycetota bacterium]